ncbi:MAG: AbgT family transporter [Gammaproteobacteria bacterium]|nr:AbgT family transporter [Gammaproteobacteria bacterium]
MTDTVAPGRLGRILNGIEVLGNRLPHPTLLFAWMALGVLVLSAIAAALGVSAVHPVSGETLQAVNLISGEGLRRILAGTVENFTGFAPLGTVLVAMLGIGIAERSGLIDALLRRVVAPLPIPRRPSSWSWPGYLSSLAADSGYVVLIPLAALVFQAAGRHPVAGIAAAFAGVSAGFSANLLIGPLDAILAGLSDEAVKLVDPAYDVSVAGNWWFIIASTFLIAARRRPWSRTGSPNPADAGGARPQRAGGGRGRPGGRGRGLRAAGIATLVLFALLLAGLVRKTACSAIRTPAASCARRSSPGWWW